MDSHMGHHCHTHEDILNTDTHLIIEDSVQLPVEPTSSGGIIIYTDGAVDATEPLHKELNIVSNGEGGNIVLEGNADQQEGVELIQISPFTDIQGDKVWQILPNNLNITTDSVVIVGDQAHSLSTVGAVSNPSRYHTQFGLVNTAQTRAPPEDAPHWAKIINDCEKVGHYYRGWVPTEQDLDIVLTLHKQQTSSYWGTRQSPAGTRPAARMMWKSQYVPFDGIPFINCGSRATVMECQFGPRRKGSKNVDYKHTCPARIYVKKVKKFPQFAIPLDVDKKLLKQLMDKSFQALRESGFEGGGEERYYMQLPTVAAHEYHNSESPALTKHAHITRTYNVSTLERGSTRLAEPVANKIRDIVSSGIHHTTTVRKMLRKYVEKELFNNEEPPVRHDLSYFPTVSDLKNHIHTALQDIKDGTLPITEASMDPLAIEEWVSHLAPQPETVTVTLTQDGGSSESSHMISRVETHMSDGSTQVSSSLTPETAALLARLHPNLIPNLQDVGQGEVDSNGQLVDSSKITELVQTALFKSTVKDSGSHREEEDDSSHNIDHAPIITMEEVHEPTPPTEGVQLDLGLHDTTHASGVTLEGV